MDNFFLVFSDTSMGLGFYGGDFLREERDAWRGERWERGEELF
jgi:hypothetical protein